MDWTMLVSLSTAAEWIALNGSDTEDEKVRSVQRDITVACVADLLGLSTYAVARKVVSIRRRERLARSGYIATKAFHRSAQAYSKRED